MRIRFDPLDPYEQIVKSVPKHNRCDFRGNYIPRLEDPSRFARSHWVESMRTKMAFKQQCETNVYSSCQIWWGSYINMFSYLVGSNVPNYGFTHPCYESVLGKKLMDKCVRIRMSKLHRRRSTLKRICEWLHRLRAFLPHRSRRVMNLILSVWETAVSNSYHPTFRFQRHTASRTQNMLAPKQICFFKRRLAKTKN